MLGAPRSRCPARLRGREGVRPPRVRTLDNPDIPPRNRRCSAGQGRIPLGKNGRGVSQVQRRERGRRGRVLFRRTPNPGLLRKNPVTDGSLNILRRSPTQRGPRTPDFQIWSEFLNANPRPVTTGRPYHGPVVQIRQNNNSEAMVDEPLSARGTGHHRPWCSNLNHEIYNRLRNLYTHRGPGIGHHHRGNIGNLRATSRKLGMTLPASNMEDGATTSHNPDPTGLEAPPAAVAPTPS